jgi:hypothetical protein
VDAWAQFVRLAAASRKGVKKGTVASTAHPRLMSLGTDGQRQAIDPMFGKNTSAS